MSVDSEGAKDGRKPDGNPCELDRKADILIYEVFDSGLIGEGCLHLVTLAKMRLLHPNAIMLPMGNVPSPQQHYGQRTRVGAVVVTTPAVNGECGREMEKSRLSAYRVFDGCWDNLHWMHPAARCRACCRLGLLSKAGDLKRVNLLQYTEAVYSTIPLTIVPLRFGDPGYNQ